MANPTKGLALMVRNIVTGNVVTVDKKKLTNILFAFEIKNCFPHTVPDPTGNSN